MHSESRSHYADNMNSTPILTATKQRRQEMMAELTTLKYSLKSQICMCLLKGNK